MQLVIEKGTKIFALVNHKWTPYLTTSKIVTNGWTLQDNVYKFKITDSLGHEYFAKLDKTETETVIVAKRNKAIKA